VPGEILEHRAQDRAVGQLVAQDFGRQASEGKQPVGALLIGQDPAERGQRQGIGISGMMSSVGGDCQRP
jgi:hypothetical protein